MGSAESHEEETLYEIFRTDILELRLRPGMMISIKDIGESYGTGRSPVRDALIRLSKEGLITFLPQRGTMISKINFDRAESGRFLRSCVEEPVMIEFMSTNHAEAVAELEASLQKQRHIAETNDCREFLSEDIRFHSIFYHAVNRSYCDQLINSGAGDYRRIRLMSLTETGIAADIIEQHQKLVDAVLEKNIERMHAIFAHHISLMISQEQLLVEKYPDLFDKSDIEVRREPDGLHVDFLLETKSHNHS
ncbi:MAG: GntR family transcriptional regulator [Hungatella sp.]